jgi:hypothetical protein
MDVLPSILLLRCRLRRTWYTVSKKKVNCREELEEEEEKEEEEEEEDWYSLDQMPITSHLLKSEWICSTQLEGKYANV